MREKQRVARVHLRQLIIADMLVQLYSLEAGTCFRRGTSAADKYAFMVASLSTPRVTSLEMVAEAVSG